MKIFGSLLLLLALSSVARAVPTEVVASTATENISVQPPIFWPVGLPVGSYRLTLHATGGETPWPVNLCFELFWNDGYGVQGEFQLLQGTNPQSFRQLVLRLTSGGLILVPADIPNANCGAPTDYSFYVTLERIQ